MGQTLILALILIERKVEFIKSTYFNIGYITDSFKDNEQAIELINVIFEGDEGLKVSNLLTENDTKLLMKSVVKILATTTGEYKDEMDRYLALASASIPYITELSILNDANRKK